MQESVNDKMGYMILERFASKGRLAANRFRRQYDISKQRAGRLRKRQDVRRLIFSPPGGVQPADSRIVGEEDADLAALPRRGSSLNGGKGEGDCGRGADGALGKKLKLRLAGQSPPSMLTDTASFRVSATFALAAFVRPGGVAIRHHAGKEPAERTRVFF